MGSLAAKNGRRPWPGRWRSAILMWRWMYSRAGNRTTITSFRWNSAKISPIFLKIHPKISKNWCIIGAGSSKFIWVCPFSVEWIPPHSCHSEGSVATEACPERSRRESPRSQTRDSSLPSVAQNDTLQLILDAPNFYSFPTPNTRYVRDRL